MLLSSAILVKVSRILRTAIENWFGGLGGAYCASFYAIESMNTVSQNGEECNKIML